MLPVRAPQAVAFASGVPFLSFSLVSASRLSISSLLAEQTAPVNEHCAITGSAGRAELDVDTENKLSLAY